MDHRIEIDDHNGHIVHVSGQCPKGIGAGFCKLQRAVGAGRRFKAGFGDSRVAANQEYPVFHTYDTLPRGEKLRGGEYAQPLAQLFAAICFRRRLHPKRTQQAAVDRSGNG